MRWACRIARHRERADTFRGKTETSSQRRTEHDARLVSGGPVHRSAAGPARRFVLRVHSFRQSTRLGCSLASADSFRGSGVEGHPGPHRARCRQDLERVKSHTQRQVPLIFSPGRQSVRSFRQAERLPACLPSVDSFRVLEEDALPGPHRARWRHWSAGTSRCRCSAPRRMPGELSAFVCLPSALVRSTGRLL